MKEVAVAKLRRHCDAIVPSNARRCYRDRAPFFQTALAGTDALLVVPGLARRRPLQHTHSAVRAGDAEDEPQLVSVDHVDDATGRVVAGDFEGLVRVCCARFRHPAIACSRAPPVSNAEYPSRSEGDRTRLRFSRLALDPDGAPAAPVASLHMRASVAHVGAWVPVRTRTRRPARGSGDRSPPDTPPIAARTAMRDVSRCRRYPGVCRACRRGVALRLSWSRRPRTKERLGWPTRSSTTTPS